MEGAKKTYRNVEELFQEASILHDHRALNRALFLHQISLEECGKIEMLGA
ncbi:AbiV family abortive infection protein [Nitrosospira multiformis]